MKHTCTVSKHFRIDESELLYMRLGTFAVSFEGYNYQTDNERTLGPARRKHEWYGAKLGITEECDFNTNDWHSPRYDFEEYHQYFDNSRGDYPFQPASKKYWEKAGKYMLWESDAWKKRSNNYWRAQGIMEEEVWKQLTDPYNNIKSAKDEVTPLDIIKNCEFTQDDLKLQPIYLHKEFDSEEELNEAHKAAMIQELQEQIEKIEAAPYGQGI